MNGAAQQGFNTLLCFKGVLPSLQNKSINKRHTHRIGFISVQKATKSVLPHPGFQGFGMNSGNQGLVSDPGNIHRMNEKTGAFLRKR